MSRAYTLEEVERMRNALQNMRSASGILNGGRHVPKDEKKEIEEEIRTYMAAGVSPSELEEKANALTEAYYAQYQRMQEHNRHLEAQIFRAHDIVKTEWQGKPKPKEKWTGPRACGDCRYFSPAMAGPYWHRCDHPTIKTKVTDYGSQKSYERPKCRDMRLPLSECGASGRLFQPAEMPEDEALWTLAQLSPDAVRRLAFNGGYLGNSIAGLTKESEDELEALGIDYPSRMNRVLIDHLMRAHRARISQNT